MRLKRLSIFLAALVALSAPGLAHATGTHPPTITPTTKPAPVKDCGACCGDLNQRVDQLSLVFNQNNQRVDQLTQQVEQLKQIVINLQAQVAIFDVRLQEVINQNETLKCRSNREYNFRLRTSVNGSKIVEIKSVSVAGDTATKMGVASPGGRAAWTDGTGRFRIWANYSGLVVPNGQLRTVTTVAVTADGRQYRLVQFLRLCLETDGNPNDTPAQDRATDGEED